MKTVGHCVIIGSSSGLGAALVEKFLSEKKFFVIGIARRRLDQIENGDRWVASGRYRHVEVDITSDECKDILTLLCKEFAAEPICVIFNAARVETDINKDGSFNYGIFSGVNRVGIDGLGNIIGAFEDHFLKHGGILIGISSFSAFMPPVFEPRIAYPASKAYMDMALRCLRVIWGDKVSIVTVHLGHMKNSGGKENIHFFSTATTYQRAAKKIFDLISLKRVPEEINYPAFFSVMYRSFFRPISDSLYLRIMRLYGIFFKR